MSDDDPVQVQCPWCGDWFEDIRAAVDENGGWCPRCDRPAAPPWSVFVVT